MAVTIATSANYWIAPNALSISLNALGEPNRIQASVSSGAQIMCYIRGVDGLDYDNGHNYRRWPLTISPTFFNTNSEKYVYAAIPRTADVGTEAIVVFPSQKIDIYGYAVEEYPTVNSRGYLVDNDGNPVDSDENAGKEQVQGELLGSPDYYYIWLQGIITSSGNGDTPRQWKPMMESGYLDSDEAVSSLETEWYRWDPISQTVTFLKEIFMGDGSIFRNLKAEIANVFNLNVTGIFDAVKGYIDDLRSHNYEAGLSDGAGFRLTNDDGEGNSLLEVDNLKVRKKATFMELEIRKETYVGGNQTYSPAGSVIYRVEYMTENNERLGYEVMKVPFLLKRFAFLGGMLRRAFNYAARRRVLRGIKEEEWDRVHHFRCYLIADDGTTATRNWWRVGDQVKCKSFNKATSQDKRTTGSWDRQTSSVSPQEEETGVDPTPISNTYFWRLVTGVGSELLDDGYVYDYIDLPCETWYGYANEFKGTFRDGGSDRPLAGDTIVCVGNRYDEARMNLVSINTYGADNNPPSIKGYRGINKFQLNDSNKVFEISPDIVRFRSKRFEFLNDDDEGFRVPLERGEWQPGLRYHYYDRVSWNGSIWLCIVMDEEVWIDMAEQEYSLLQIPYIDYGEGSYWYDGVNRDHYYATGRINEGDLNPYYYKVKAYTYLEPSDQNNAVWLCEVSKGTEITESVIHYAASLDGINHPDDESDVWKDTIAATNIKAGQYLWTRRTTYYRDPNNPDREPTREYSVSRWGIDGDGIAQINSYYLATDQQISITPANDNYPMPGDAGWPSAGIKAKWFDSFDACASANGGVGAMQGWYVWEKTVITYDMADNPDGSARTKPDLITYQCNRIGQDGQIGQEEYYTLLEYDTFERAFTAAAPVPHEIGIYWYDVLNPGREKYRLMVFTDGRVNICTEENKDKFPGSGSWTPVWSPIMPVYDKSTPAKARKRFLWNFEYRVDGMGTEYATRPICIGDHSRGIVGLLELYACSASAYPRSGGKIPADIYEANNNSETDYSLSDSSKPKTWSDEKYDRAPTEDLPYQWNWTRTLYSTPKADGDSEPTDPNTGWWYEDHYHVSAVKGTRGEDGAGVEYVYFRSNSAAAPDAPPSSGNGEISPNGVANGTAAYDKTIDDWVPNGWSDNPIGVDLDHQYEYISERRSKATAGTGGFTGGHEWGTFSAPKLWSKYGQNGQDGDGVEYVFMRTKKDVAPTFAANDGGGSNDYKSQEWLPYINNKDACSAESNRCTDDPKGTTRDWPYEWVAKRTMGSPSNSSSNYGHRDWKSYYECMADHKMAKWSTYTTLRLDIDNEMDMVQTDSKGKVMVSRTVETVVHLYDGSTEVQLESTRLTTDGDLTASGKGYKLSWTFNAGTVISTMEKSVSYEYNGQTYTAVFTIAASMGQPIYQLQPSAPVIKFSRTANNELAPEKVTLKMDVLKIDGGSSGLVDGFTGLKVRYSTSAMPTSASDGQAWTYNSSVDIANTFGGDSVYFALFNSSNVLLDRETIPVVKDGLNGASITKVSETYRYATNQTGARPAASSSDWSNTKPTLNKGYWLFTETTITWSDDSTTVLYTDERNPNDGIAGQDIIVDGSTEIKYSCKDSNTINPTTINDWADYNQVTKVKGQWLWSKATTFYRKADSAAGSHDAGSSVNYNVSYIATDGTSPYFADIDNEMDSIACDASGKTTAAYDSTVGVHLWHGASEIDITTLTTNSITGITITPNKTNKNVRIQVANGTSIAEVSKINITIAGAGSGNLQLRFVLNGVRAGANGQPATIYSLVPSVASVTKKKDGTYSVNNVSCTRQKNVGGTITDNTTDGEIKYKLDGGTEQAYTNNTNIAVTGFSKSLQFIFRINNVIVDTETIPMVADGTDGRGITKITEYYKATDSSAAMSVPTSDSGWDTDPNLSNLTNKWGETYKYLWNYEKVEYSSGATVERTKPQLLAVWTKDGATGKGIDSITNYYKVTQSSTAPGRPTTDGTDGWDDDPTAPGQGEYLWNYEKITWINPAGTTYTDVQLIGYVGEDSTNYTIECADTIKPGDTSLAVSVKRVVGTDIQIKAYRAASIAWNVTLSASISGGGSATISSNNVTLGGTITKDSILTLTLKKGTTTIATKIIRAVADGGQGEQGKTGLWYQYAGVWGVDVSTNTGVTNTDKVGWYVKYGNNFYMNTKPAANGANTNTPGTGSYWVAINSAFKYYIVDAIFGDYAHFGSFIINGDWMISQYGTKNGSTSNDYTSFSPSNMTNQTGFIPTFAVDGKTGRVYMQDAYVKGIIYATGGEFNGKIKVVNATDANSYIEISSSGLISRYGNDGIKIDANGLQRYDYYNSAWKPFFSKRSARLLTPVDNNIKVSDDLLLLNGTPNYVTLPASPSNGDVKTIRVLGNGSAYLHLGSSSHKLYTDASFNYTDININNQYALQQNNRYELVFWNNVWYLNRMGL